MIIGAIMVYKNNIYAKPVWFGNTINKYDLNSNLLLEYKFCNIFEKYDCTAFTINLEQMYIIIADEYEKKFYINIYDIHLLNQI